MQTIYIDENEESTSGGTNLVGVVICVGRSSKHVERKCIGRPGRMTIRI